MAKATWRIVALSALLGAVAPVAFVAPAQAQVVIGGTSQPDVVVNWGVLDSLGRQPSLADMLKADMQGRDGGAALTPPGGKRTSPSTGSQGLTFKPYKPGKTKSAAVKPTKPAKVAVTKPAPVAKPQPLREEPADIAAMVQQRKAVEPAKAEAPAKVVATSTAKPAVPPKPPVAESVPAAKGPEIALPEVKKTEPAVKPAELAKAAESVKTQEIAKAVEQVKAAAPVPAPVKAPEPAKIVDAVKAEAAKTPEAAKVAEVAKAVETAAEPPKPIAVPAPAAIAAAPQTLLAPVPPPIPVMPQQVAALPSSEATAMARGSDTLSLMFAAEDSKLSEGSRADLAALVKRMQKDEDLNLQLLAYASGDEASSSKARRLSLSRALEVRKALMDKGIRSTRIEVRALGNKLDGRGPADRVDAVLMAR